MLELVFERAKGMILNPVGNFRLAANDTISFTVVYYLILLAVFGILFSFALSGLNRYMLYNAQFMTTIIVMLGQMIVSLFVSTGWFHLWVYVVGGRQGIVTTLKVVAYAMTPYLLIGWLIPVGLVAGFVWYLVLVVLGIRELQQLPTGRAVLAFALALIVGFIIAFAVLILIDPSLLSALSGSTQGGSYRPSYSF
ncbi:MAG: Yip1 domain protein [Methanoregula sp. PtaU1.Bin051]|nr:MAG: Yip1 domain protein [Methanoregula sp. PtaU1.Bin051]